MRHWIAITLIFGCLSLLAQNQNNYVEARDCAIRFDSLDVKIDRKNRVSTYYYQGELFNGCARQDEPKFEKYYLHYVKDGRLERQLGYYDNGQKSRDYQFKNGFAHGLLQLFYDDGSPYIREEYVNGKLHGSLKRWKRGQLVREAEFWNGSMVWEKKYALEKKGEEDEKKNGC